MTEPRGLQVTPAILLAALSIGTLCRAAEPAGDWPTWRYDAARSAACPHRLADTLHLQWVRRYPPTSPAWPDQNRLHFDTEYRPVVMGGTLFLGSPRADWVAAVDAETGRERWRTYTGGPVRFAPAAADGRLYVASDDGRLYCLDAADGSVVWRRAMSPHAARRVLGNKRLISTWPVRGGPALAGGRLYVAAGIWPWMGVFIRAVDPKTGETIWCNSGSGSKLRGQPHCGEAFTGPAPQGYLAVVGDRVLVPNGRAVAACFDAGTGSLRHFRYGATRADGSYFVAAGRRYYFNRKVVFGVKTGTRFRRIPGTPVVGDGVLYSRDTAYDLANAAPFRHTVADRTQTGLRLPRLWQLPDAGIGRVWIKTADKLYASCGREHVEFKFPKPGGKPSACWRAEIDGEAGSVLAGAGRLFVVTDDGSLYAYGAEQRTAKIYPIPPAVGPKWDRWARRAAEIVEATGRRAGYALVLGVESGRLVEELARQTRLHVIGIAGPGVRVDKVRRRLDRPGSTAPGRPFSRATDVHPSSPTIWPS
ncbi:MAG: PQQ-binding-like beta-propeller repeat protein [Planctomycetota bacterium]